MPSRRRIGIFTVIATLSLATCAGGNDLKDRAIDFFDLLKNHLLPQHPKAPDASASAAHRTEVRGNCLHEYYTIHPRLPVTIASTNYPGPYPPNECRKLVLIAADPHTSVVLTCTDVDTFAFGVLGDVNGDFLEFPGPYVNRRSELYYGMDTIQCAAVPFTRRTPPGQALKMAFYSDAFVQRRGFSCQAWGEELGTHSVGELSGPPAAPHHPQEFERPQEVEEHVGIDEDFGQTAPLPSQPGFSRPGSQQKRPVSHPHRRRPERRPSSPLFGLQMFADLFSGQKASGSAPVPVRVSYRRQRKLRLPPPRGHVRFPNRRRRRSLTEQILPRILTGADRSISAAAPAVTDNSVSLGKPPNSSFKPPEVTEYIIAPIRNFKPADVEEETNRTGHRPMFQKIAVDVNTTASPVIDVPYFLTPESVTLHASGERDEPVTRIFTPSTSRFPTTPRSEVDRSDPPQEIQPVSAAGQDKDDLNLREDFPVVTFGSLEAGHLENGLLTEGEKTSKPPSGDNFECGLPGPTVQSRVFGGEDALPGHYPWVVYLISDTPRAPTKTTYCAGSLISDTIILTAAHCVDYAISTTVHFGFLDVSKETDHTLKVNATKFHVHKYWSRLVKDHDVGLIELPSPVKFTRFIRPICLPRRSEVGLTFAGLRGEICGWGKTKHNQVGGSFVLQRAEVDVKDNCECMASFPINVTPLKICMHGRYSSPCEGDSGGPLQVRRGDRYTLVGINSFTTSLGCDAGFPAMCTRVTAYLDWIEQNSGITLPL